MSRVKNMFKFTNKEREGNLVLFVKDGYEHKYEAGYEYAYNALKFFWDYLIIYIGILLKLNKLC